MQMKFDPKMTPDQFMELVPGGYFSLSRKRREVQMMTLGVSDRLMRAAQTNPDSVRVAARDAEGVSIFERAMLKV